MPVKTVDSDTTTPFEKSDRVLQCLSVIAGEGNQLV